MLIGVPCSGKSSWHCDQEWLQHAAYISTDIYVEEYAKNMGKTYSEVFQEVMPKCVEYMTGDVIHAREAGQDIVWDQTNLGAKARKGKLKTVPKHYEKIALVIPPTKENLERVQRVNQERKSKGRSIPDHIMSNMAKQFEMPTEAEGFDEVIVF